MKEKGLALVDELRELYSQVPPPPGGLDEGRQQMMAQAAALKPSAPPAAGRRFLGRLRTAPTRAVCILALVVFILAATGGSVALASGSSLPGDPLYPVKLAVEDFRLALTADPAAQAERNLTFVVERVEEMKGLADRDEIIPDEVVTRMADQMDTVMTKTTAASPEKGPDLLEQLELGILVQQYVLTKIQAEGSQEGNPDALNAALQVNQHARLAADSAKGDPNRLEHEYQILTQPTEPLEEPQHVDNSDPHQENNGTAGDPQGPQGPQDPQDPQGPQGPGDGPADPPPGRGGNQNRPGAGNSGPDETVEPDPDQTNTSPRRGNHSSGP